MFSAYLHNELLKLGMKVVRMDVLRTSIFKAIGATLMYQDLFSVVVGLGIPSFM